MSDETKSQEPSINDLKAQVYDYMTEAEQHQMAIQQLQQKINEVNKNIAAKLAISKIEP